MSWFGPALTLGECPRWDDRRATLSWVDIDGGTLHEARLVGQEWFTVDHHVGAPLAGAVRRVDRDDWLIALGGTLAGWSRPGPPCQLALVEPDRAEHPLRLNEMVTDPVGRLWVGSMAYDWTRRLGAFYRVDLDGSVHRVIDHITIANGVGWSPDSATVYTTDTGPAVITAWDYDVETGRLGRARPFVQAEAEDGKPDGLAVDTEGNVWSAFAGGYRVSCFSPAGGEIHRVTVPAPNPTSCCFAGTERDRLVITTGRKRLPIDVLAAYPDSGRVWDAGRLGAIGLPQHPYAGAAPEGTAQPVGKRTTVTE